MKRGLLAVFLVLIASSASQAGPLGVPVDPIPSLIAGFINTSYNATTGAFNANGFALTLDQGLGKKTISGAFQLQATIDPSGVATNATVRVGTVGAPQLFSSTLLPLQFAFNPISGGTLEFLFGTVSGTLVSTNVYSATQPLDVLFTGLGGFPGNFNTSWSATSSTAELREDPPPVPEPSTLLLMLVGTGGLCRQFRKRKKV